MATAGDRAVLHSIFHPDMPFGGAEEEAGQQGGGAQAEEDAFAPELLEEARRLEARGVAAAEGGDLDGALESFGRAIELLPARPSAFNNRAQAFRLRGDVASALSDLETALRLSGRAGPVGRQALVQRGLIHRLRGEAEAARADFEAAASLGSPFARQQLLRMNPYAALCNQMLAQAMKQLHGPEEEPSSPRSSSSSSSSRAGGRGRATTKM